MEIVEQILQLARSRKTFTTKDVISKAAQPVSRQYVTRVLSQLIRQGQLAKGGTTKDAVYSLPQNALWTEPSLKLVFKNQGLDEDVILSQVRLTLPGYQHLHSLVKKAFEYSFSEMLNNAIEHSNSEDIQIVIKSTPEHTEFAITDSGVGIFTKIQNQWHLNSELEAVRFLLKGKATTSPQNHSGEGIFFTSKTAALFLISSHSHRLRVDNSLPDTFIEPLDNFLTGTTVFWRLTGSLATPLDELFKKFQSSPDTYKFDQTSVLVRLYSLDSSYISRSQARRLLAGLEKFSLITLDFAQVESVGQGFCDEVFRVFSANHPEIRLDYQNVSSEIETMILHVK